MMRPLAILGAGLLGSLLLSVLVGAAPVAPGDVFRAFLGQADATTSSIVLGLRLPRALLAVLVGGALAASGVVFQALLRNPLADPYVLGVSGGAAVGAVIAVVLGLAGGQPWVVPAAAFVGGAGAIALVLRIALAVGSTLSARVFILAGVVAAAFFNALILLLLSLADAESFRSAVFWMMGSLAAASWGQVLLLASYGLPSLVVLLLMARPLNLLAVGEEAAAHLGVRVERTKRLAYLVTSLLVAAAVAVAGVIGFVGLIVPHALRLVWGSDHRLLLPASVLAGAGFLLLTDTVARTVVSPGELPTGVLTALLGVPLFVVLLIRGEG